jgi:hypothetical protein
MNTKLILGSVLGVVILGFGYYAISPLFNTIKANDSAPQSAVVTQSVSSETSATTTHNRQMTPNTTPAQVTGSIGHPASGTVKIVAANGKNYVRYENFKTINGPDLYVYLSKDLNAKDYVSLGKVTATDGNINYEIPANVNTSDYKYVLTWCKTFGVLFNSGQIH